MGCDMLTQLTQLSLSTYSLGDPFNFMYQLYTAQI